MKIINQSFEILDNIDRNTLLQKIELAGRTCYKSEEKITPTSASAFVKKIVDTGHLSVIEHVNVSVKFITNRGVTHELVRHRIASYSQESTRYVNYNKEMIFIQPHWFDQPESNNSWLAWRSIMGNCETAYNFLLKQGLKPEDARGVLPNDLKTEIVVTANLREWKHILTLRTSPRAHPQIRQLMNPLLDKFKELLPEIF
jgi:thymidylate synthase (FAD)